MLDQEILQHLPALERLMKEGKIPYVRVIGPTGDIEKLPVPPPIMQELGLLQGQKVDSILVEVISEKATQMLMSKMGEMQ